MKTLRYAWVYLLLLAGCASLGVPSPSSFNERVAAAQTATIAIIDGSKVLLDAKKITYDDAVNIVKQTDNIMEALQIARTLNGTNPVAANDKLSATLLALNALQSYLAKKGP